jgi:hypothetical protein
MEKICLSQIFLFKRKRCQKVQDFFTKLLITGELIQYNIFSKFSLTSSKGLINCRKLRPDELYAQHAKDLWIANIGHQCNPKKGELFSGK